jgi:hypothetical protein
MDNAGVLAKRTIWIGDDPKLLRIDERLFQAVPDVWNYLRIEECLISKYDINYTITSQAWRALISDSSTPPG